MLRRLSSHRAQLVRGRIQVKNQVQAVLHRNMLPRPPVNDLFGTRGRDWLAHQALPVDERETVTALLRQLDFCGAELSAVERRLAIEALDDPVVKRLMTIPGVDAMTAVTVLAAVGDFHRFSSADKLVSYLGLNPTVRQSGGAAAHHGRITKAGCGKARGMLVQAAFAALRAPGPLRALHQRIKARRGMQIAIVAVARKIAVIAWHLVTKEQDYAFARPGLAAFKRRKLELTAGAERRNARRGPGYDYNDKDLRRQEREIAEQAERAYTVLAAQFQAKRPAGKPRLPAIPGTEGEAVTWAA
jgi:hypothetical protein